MIPSFKTIIYLHGFQSSSSSQKARSLAAYLKENYPTIDLKAPNLPFSPSDTLELVEKEIESSEKPVLMGSSMGAIMPLLSQAFSVPAVLINPVVDPKPLVDSLFGQDIVNSYTGEQYCFGNDDLVQFNKINQFSIKAPGLIFNLIETGDEVLDYRLAEKKYKICAQKIIHGGDHRFQNFESCLPEIIRFYNSASQIG